MRKIGSLVIVVALVGLALGTSAQAAGNGAMKVDLLVGYYPGPGDRSEILLPPTKVGQVVFNATGSGMMQVSVHVKDGTPNTTFQVFCVPQATWGTLAEQGLLTITTNARGNAGIHLARPIPEVLTEVDYFKVVVRDTATGEVYVTDRYDIDAKP
jgi:hypothetical protein